MHSFSITNATPISPNNRNTPILELEKFEFVATQFCEWTTKDRRIAARIAQWKDVADGYYGKAMKNTILGMIDKAINYGPAINTGVFAFTRESKLMQDWYDYALRGIKFFIPDELACQILISNGYPHYVADHSYNESCKYGEMDLNTKVIHFHGRKHCRIGANNEPIYNSDLWYTVFDEIKDKVKDLVKFDRHICRNLPLWEKIKAA